MPRFRIIRIFEAEIEANNEEDARVQAYDMAPGEYEIDDLTVLSA